MKKYIVAIALTIIHINVYADVSEQRNKMALIKLYSSPEFTGTVMDSHSRLSIPYAVISAKWILRRSEDLDKPNSEERYLWVEETVSDDAGNYKMTGFTRKRSPKGWELVPGRDPEITVYNSGYYSISYKNTYIKDNKTIPLNTRYQSTRKIALKNKPLMITPVKSFSWEKIETETWLAELKKWRSDIDAGVLKYKWHDPSSAESMFFSLVGLLGEHCKLLSADNKETICYSEGTVLGRAQKNIANERKIIMQKDADSISEHAINSGSKKDRLKEKQHVIINPSTARDTSHRPK